VLTERVRNQRLREWINRVYDRSDVRWHDGSRFEKETLTKILLPSERNGMMEEG
jgi:GTP-dependent phosphoenolpyruvate carboxykinase